MGNKKLLRDNRSADQQNFAVLEGFLSKLLFDDIKIERILESEGKRNVAPQDSKDDKFNRVDILTQNSKKELIVVEIQNTYEIDWVALRYFQRIAYGASKALTENLGLGKFYLHIKKIISVNIVYFDLGQGKDYVYKGLTTFEGLHKKDILQLSSKQQASFSKEKVSDIFPEYYIIKVGQFKGKAKDHLDEWIYFLKNSEVRDDFSAKGLAEAKEILDIMRLNPEQQYGYNRYLDYLHYKASEIFSLQMEAEARVREDERQNEKSEIAKNAILEGANDNFIAKITGLSLEQIIEIRAKLI